MSSSTALDEAAHGASETIQIFTHELPDPDGLLSLHTFYKFQELPIEIRLQIWRETFPGPRLFRLLFPLYSTAMNLRILPPSPPTAHAVNQESRVELFREYQHVPAVIPLKNDTSEHGLVLFSPGKDVLSVSCGEFHKHVRYWKYPVTDSIASLLCAIRTIEIFGQKCVMSARNGANYQHTELFKMFKNLEEVRIIETADHKTVEESWESVVLFGCLSKRLLNYKAFRDYIYEELKLRTERDPSIEIPAIASWKLVLKENTASSPEIGMGWFKNRVEYCELIPAVECEE
ncbi:hypothetical protein HYFRA_00012855 [Hymenoscyphus fraxineus]|uniref:2EXR domain-containing protein n=1 Tax=Hymenoscyphus fraxineus TaxID=746836 RepID=A0A9N9PM10_9HELO|nr:hypothetical protein HYFRA_00012855 [Hymenoscyphus fraxineus]